MFLLIILNIQDYIPKPEFDARFRKAEKIMLTPIPHLQEFQLSKKFQTTIDNQKVSLENAILNEDGSIQVNNEKVFGLR